MSHQQKPNNEQKSAVPEGWKEVSLGDTGKWRGGGTPSKANPAFWTAGTIPWVSPKDMKSLRIGDAEDHITEDAIKNSATSLIPENSLLVVTRSGILRHSLPTAITTRDVAINQDIKALRPSKGFDVNYLANIFWGLEKDLLEKCQKDGTTVESIDFDSLKNYRLAVPPLPEQIKIASILSDWDDSLSILAKLIEAKRQQKRGLAEQLLTGKKRLPGFDEEWDEKKLGEVFHLLIGGTPSRSNADYWDFEKTSDNVWLAISDLKGKYASDSKERISDAGVQRSNVKLIPADTVVMSFKLTLGRAAITTRPLYTNEAICAFIPVNKNVVDTEYFYQSIAVMDFTEGVDIAVKGATMNKEKLTNFSFMLPPLPEQQAIAAVLSTLDAEISSLTSLRSSLLVQKRGLMDLLLTGRVRVKVEGNV